MERHNINVTHSLCCSWNLEFSDHHDIGREIKNDSFSTWRRFSFRKSLLKNKRKMGLPTWQFSMLLLRSFISSPPMRNQDFRILLNLVVGHGLHGQFLGDRNNNNTEENHEDQRTKVKIYNGTQMCIIDVAPSSYFSCTIATLAPSFHTIYYVPKDKFSSSSSLSSKSLQQPIHMGSHQQFED